ncbi:MAG: PilW family protein [Lautropia sp.]
MVPSARQRACSSGFSIVELMVSLALSSFVILAVVGIYSGSRESYSTQDEISRLHENVRIGVGLIERTLRQGNYKRIPILRDQNLVLVQAFSFAPVAGTDGGGAASDTLELVYNGNDQPTVPPSADGTIVDCVGEAVGADVQSRNRFSIQSIAGRPWLGCTRPNHPTNTAFVPLIPDVEAMQVLYGTYSDESRTASNFVPWSAAIDPMRVVAIRLHLLFRSSEPIAPAPSNKVYTLAGEAYGPYTDRFVRTTVETTVVIRSAAM